MCVCVFFLFVFLVFVLSLFHVLIEVSLLHFVILFHGFEHSVLIPKYLIARMLSQILIVCVF